MSIEQISPNTEAGTTLVTTATSILESLASKHSTHVYVYDSATDVGIGSLTKQWSTTIANAARVLDMETRAGAGLSIAGRLSEGTSSPAVMSAFLTPATLAYMLPSLSLLPPATPSSRAVFHVADTNEFPLPDLSVIPHNFQVIFSSAPQEIADIAAHTYAPSSSHVIHIFDYQSAARELRELVYPSISQKAPSAFIFNGSKTSNDVILALNTALSTALASLHTYIPSLSVLSIRSLFPFPSLNRALPHSIKTLHILGDPILHQLVLTSKLGHSSSLNITYHPSFNPKVIASAWGLLAYLDRIIPNAPSTPTVPSPPHTLKKLLFYGADSNLPQKLISPFFSASSISTRLLPSYDAVSSTAQTRVLLSPKSSPTFSTPFDHLLPAYESSADFIGIFMPQLLKTHSQAILSSAKPGAAILITSPYSPEEVISYLPLSSQLLVKSRSLRLFTISPSAENADIATHLAFLRLYLGESSGQAVVGKVAKSIYGESVVSDALVNDVWEGLKPVPAPALDKESDGKAKEELNDESVLRNFEFSIPSASLISMEDAAPSGSQLSSWHSPALSLLFPSSTSSAIALRPEIPATATYLVTCTANRRLTPDTYDRNVFHLEFDTSGTGLTYKIGEALGIFGWNDEGDVREFLDWYTDGKVKGDEVVSFTLEGQGGKRWTRTVFQALQQNIDLFGRPPKSFYAALAPYATTKSEQQILRFVSAPEGASLFKKLAEVDTVHFADVMQRFKSARPPLDQLMEMIGPIKERHYSIASAQSVVGEQVDLLVVSVDWVTPSGMPPIVCHILVMSDDDIQGARDTDNVQDTSPVSTLVRR
jgi:sulfite reductase (NADPH) flavoprotein alpha-component